MSAFSITRQPDSGVSIVCDAGYEPIPGILPIVAQSLLETDVVAVTGDVVFTSHDGVHTSTWSPSALTIAGSLSDPRAVPPVWAMRVDAEAFLDARPADAFAPVDAWIRLLRSRPYGRVMLLRQPIARFDLVHPTRWEQLLASGDYERALRAFLDRHRDDLKSALREVFVSRELSGVRLGAIYAETLRRRDADSAEMARLESVIAEGRARLAQLGRPELDWGTFSRTSPVARDWGSSRGGPIDRRYICDFIASHSSDVRGRVLEVQEDDLMREFGGLRVSEGDIVDVRPANPRASVIADLRHAAAIPDSRYDCIILTQTAHLIDDMAAVIRECHRILTPRGVLLATFPCLSRLCLDYGPDGDFWRLTPAGARTLLSGAFEQVDIETFGNVKTAVAFLHGLGQRELSDADYAATDPYNPMLVGARARKRPSSAAFNRVRGIVLAYHRIEAEASDRFDLNVSHARLAEHLEWLRQHASIVPLDDLLECDMEELPENAVALTFDDGYVAHLEEVAPLLVSGQISATYFVTTAGLMAPREYWWDQLERWDAAESDVRAMHHRLMHAQFDEREELQRSLRPHAESRPSRRPLLGDEVRRLASIPGMTIGAHGVHHLHLPDQPDDAKRAELRDSRRSLEAIIGRPVRIFAYPHGGVDRTTAMLARGEFHWAVTGRTECVRQSFDAARVPRLIVKAWDVSEFAARLASLRAPATDPVRLLP